MLGACRGADMALFFHPDGERGHARSNRQREAKAVCARCPVVSDCRTHAVTHQETWGTWGGLSEDERTSLLRRSAVGVRTHRRVGERG